MPKNSKPAKSKNPKKPTPKEEVLEDCSVLFGIAVTVEDYITKNIESDELKAYLLGRMTALKSNIDVIGNALNNPEEAHAELIEGEGAESVSNIFDDIFTRLGNIESGLATVGIGVFCEDCGKYAPPVERIEEEPEPAVCFIPPKKEEIN